LKSVDSTDSAKTTSTDTTVKWRDTVDVEFSMPHTGNIAAPDSWQRVASTATPSAPLRKVSRTTRTESTNSSANSAVDIMKRTLQSTLENVQSLFNPAYKEFRFKDYSPGLFAKVRSMCNIGSEEYASSFETTCKETFSEGRSGAFMFYSSDQRCIAKSTTKSELVSLLNMMPNYIKYLVANPNSLISRFLGAHCITMYGVELYFIVMLNIFPPFKLSERYDLKGSWVNRHGVTRDYKSSGSTRTKDNSKAPNLYLDNDLQQKISLQAGVAPLVVDQIFKDVEFLRCKLYLCMYVYMCSVSMCVCIVCV
jgi:hypothetical protein